MGKLRLRLGEDLSFQGGRFQQQDGVAGLWGQGLERSSANFGAQCAEEKKPSPHLRILLPQGAA